MLREIILQFHQHGHVECDVDLAMQIIVGCLGRTWIVDLFVLKQFVIDFKTQFVVVLKPMLVTRGI